MMLQTKKGNSLKQMAEACINCNICVKECEFLRKHGSPGQIFDRFRSDGKRAGSISFECSLCGLCTSLCPKDIDPVQLFLDMRRFVAREGLWSFNKYKRLLRYQKTGVSKRYTWYGLPEGCDTVYFPGCTFSGTRPESTFRVFEYLKRTVPSIGVVLDCCSKISHDLGREDEFCALFGEMRNYLVQNGIRRILVNCPNCYNVFRTYGDSLEVKTVYEVFADAMEIFPKRSFHAEVTVHDPCVVRFEPSVRKAVRDLILHYKMGISEMPHSLEKTLCCGEGGGVPFISPEFSSAWTKRRKQEAGSKRVVTYCAGCANFLGKELAVDHVIDLLFEPEKFIDRSLKVSSPPVTYLNRILLKRKFKKKVAANRMRERPSELNI